MSTSDSNPQSATARRAADAELRKLVVEFAPAHQRLVGTVRRWLRKRLPTACEVVYRYSGFFVISCSPSEHGYEGVFAVRGSAEGVRLYLNSGKGLPDPEKLLQGSGKQARWMSVDSAATLRRPAVVQLVEAAIARNRVPFGRSGRGPIVIRPASAK